MCKLCFLDELGEGCLNEIQKTRSVADEQEQFSDLSGRHLPSVIEGRDRKSVV